MFAVKLFPEQHRYQSVGPCQEPLTAKFAKEMPQRTRRTTDMVQPVLLSAGGMLYTYRFWKSLDWSPCEIKSTDLSRWIAEYLGG